MFKPINYKAMKRTLFSFLALVLAIPCFSQKEVSSYYSTYFSKDFSVMASYQDNGSLKEYITIESDRGDDNTLILLEGSEITSFIESINKIKTKYLEWVNVAKENNVTDMSKEFDISMPRVTIAWYSSDWFFHFRFILKPRFVVTAKGKAVFVITGEATASSNEYITRDIYFALEGEKDFDGFLEAISPDKIKEKLDAEQNKKDLFK